MRGSQVACAAVRVKHRGRLRLRAVAWPCVVWVEATRAGQEACMQLSTLQSVRHTAPLQCSSSSLPLCPGFGDHSPAVHRPRHHALPGNALPRNIPDAPRLPAIASSCIKRAAALASPPPPPRPTALLPPPPPPPPRSSPLIGVKSPNPSSRAAATLQRYVCVIAHTKP